MYPTSSIRNFLSATSFNCQRPYQEIPLVQWQGRDSSAPTSVPFTHFVPASSQCFKDEEPCTFEDCWISTLTTVTIPAYSYLVPAGRPAICTPRSGSPPSAITDFSNSNDQLDVPGLCFLHPTYGFCGAFEPLRNIPLLV